MKRTRLAAVLDLQNAISLLEEGDAREASQLLEEMAEEMPGYPTARVLLARAYERLDEWNLALAAWREVLHMIPNSPVARRGLQRAARRAAVRHSIDEVVETGHGVPMETAPPSFEEDHAVAAESTVTDEKEREAVESLVDAETRREAEAPENREPAVDSALEEHTEESGPHEEPPQEAGEGAEQHEAHDQPSGTAEGEADEVPRPYRIEEVEGTLPEGAAEYGDLDRLIDELESARIVPRTDLEEMASPDLEDDIEDVVSETLARIYASQGQYEEAAHVYELLATQQPDKAAEFMSKASEMRSRASDQR